MIAMNTAFQIIVFGALLMILPNAFSMPVQDTNWTADAVSTCRGVPIHARNVRTRTSIVATDTETSVELVVTDGMTSSDEVKTETTVTSESVVTTWDIIGEVRLNSKQRFIQISRPRTVGERLEAERGAENLLKIHLIHPYNSTTGLDKTLNSRMGGGLKLPTFPTFPTFVPFPTIGTFPPFPTFAPFPDFPIFPTFPSFRAQ